MRLSVFAGFLIIAFATPALAEQCETMVIRDPSGTVVSSSMMCVDAAGVWTERPISAAPPQPIAPPARVSAPAKIAAPEPVSGPSIISAPPKVRPQVAAPAPTPVVKPATPVIVKAAPTPIPNANTWQPQVIQPLPSPKPLSAQPILAAPAVVQPVTVAPTIFEPVVATPTFQNAPADSYGPANRHEAYAKLGLVCNAKRAVYCTANSCSGLCEGQLGWCDGRTGETYSTLAAMERLYCKTRK